MKKKYYLNQTLPFILTSIILLFNACRDYRSHQLAPSNDGITVRLLTPQYREQTVLRAANSDQYENKIAPGSCYIILFNKDNGQRIAGGVPSNITSEDAQETYPIEIKNITIYAVANYNTSRAFTGPSINDLNNVHQITDLQNLKFKYKKASSADQQGYIPMEGVIDYVATGVGSYTIDVPMHQIEAKISLDISVTDPQKATFIPDRWRICNIPKEVKLLSNPKLETFSTLDPNQFEIDTQWHLFEEVSTSLSTNNIDKEEIVNAFTTYTPQNRPETQNKITVAGYNTMTGLSISATDFDTHPEYAFRMRASREKQLIDPLTGQVRNGDFIYAPKTTTYIQITGKYTTIDDTDKIKTTANVIYTIPLGYVNSPIIDDYMIEPGTHYKYHVKISGVENIILEATKNNDSTPKNTKEFDSLAEGEVVRTINEQELDCHYGTFIIKINRQDLIAYKNAKIDYYKNILHQTNINEDTVSVFDYNVITPFDDHGKKDLSWIHFTKTKLENGYYKEELPDDLEEKVYSQTRKTVKELSEDLKSHINDNSVWDTDGSICYAALVNEYYYDQIPKDTEGHILSNTTPFNTSEAEWAKNGWQLVVNRPDRIMNFFYKKGSLQISADNNSTFMQPDFSIRQKSIKTTNTVPRIEKLLPVMGFEIIDEVYQGEDSPTDNTHTYVYQNKLANPYAAYKGDLDNYALGYRPTLAMYGLIDANDQYSATIQHTKRWDEFRLRHKDHFRPKYLRGNNATGASIIYNCLARNSDLNGNGVIDQNEIRWYIPSYKQVMQMVTVDPTLAPDERLQNSQWAVQHPHYIMTTVGFNENMLNVVWINQKYAFGKIGDSGYTGAPNWMGSVRCVRNLGVPTDNIIKYERGIYDPIKLRAIYNRYGQDESSKQVRAKGMGGYSNFYSGASNYPFLYPGKHTDDRDDDLTAKSGMGIVVDMRNIKTAALRTTYWDKTKGELPKHYTFSGYNRPYYKGFRVASYVLAAWGSGTGRFYGEHYKWETGTIWKRNDIKCSDYEERNPDGTITRGWRMPNQAELAIMTAYIPWGDANNSRGWASFAWGNHPTWFYQSLSRTWIRRGGSGGEEFYINQDQGGSLIKILSVAPPGETYTMRCVKDWDPEYGDYTKFDNDDQDTDDSGHAGNFRPEIQ